MNKLENLWAGWRKEYLSLNNSGNHSDDSEKTLFEGIDQSQLPDEETFVIEKRKLTMVLLNVYPYTSGHLLVVPRRPVETLAGLSSEEHDSLWKMVTDATTTLQEVFSPEGINVGLNQGEAAGAGVPDHLHVHVVPRWSGDTNFTTVTANTRVIPEALIDTWTRISETWPRES
ncbi:MAG: HIT domain-containing protein [Acidimicrobiales bacterium]|nr:HIT family hydrolase [Acidimicrobiaceae bacterium]MDP6323550.1 HIT domain-containing protein [Acidimicrobiales bacterium]MDP6894047.1 HIT domain-containing protein [Acidimicrobiales bacterium]HJM37966.1 HIT domain-containing protein [Acidimicrobiales bacterium]